MNKFPLLVSLPKNDIALVDAALQGGADGVKVHLNCFHRASGNSFGNFSQEKTFLEQLAAKKTRKFVMIGQETLPTEAEMSWLSEHGFEGYNLYLYHAQSHIFKSQMTPILALAHGFTSADIQKVLEVPNAMIEASIVDPNDYGKPLSQEDVEQYKKIYSHAKRAVIVPTQKNVTPEEIHQLKDAHVYALLMGVIVLGADAASIEKNVKRFVKARDAIA